MNKPKKFEYLNPNPMPKPGQGGSEPWRACTAPCEIEPELRELSNFGIALDGAR